MVMDAYDALIIGSGPAGMFAAMQFEHLGVNRIALIDRRTYPAGGLLNDGKLNFDYRIGIDLDELKVNRHSAERMMEEIRQVFIHFPRCQQVTFVDNNKKIEALANIAEEYGAQFIAPEQWHWGTDNGKTAVDYLRNQLKETGFLLDTAVTSIAPQNDDTYHVFCVNQRKKACLATKVILAAPGRSGAYWFRDLAIAWPPPTLREVARRSCVPNRQRPSFGRKGMCQPAEVSPVHGISGDRRIRSGQESRLGCIPDLLSL